MECSSKFRAFLDFLFVLGFGYAALFAAFFRIQASRALELRMGICLGRKEWEKTTMQKHVVESSAVENS